VKYAPALRPATTLVLQNGLNGYAGCVDTMLGSTTPGTDNSATASIVSDIDYGTQTSFSAVASAGGGTQISLTVASIATFTAGNTAAIMNSTVPSYNGTWVIASASGVTVVLNRAFNGNATGLATPHTGASGDRQGLLKFDLSSVPAGSTVIGAKLVLYDNTEGKGWELHRMIAPWTGSSTWNSLTSGVTCDDTEAAYNPDTHFLPTAFDAYTGFVTHNLPVPTVQGWVDGAFPNEGWAVLACEEPTGDGFQWDSSESATQARKPMLIIRFVAP
jgi:hypothetical protein